MRRDIARVAPVLPPLVGVVQEFLLYQGCIPSKKGKYHRKE
jgi:hypothetical protein